jgi:hypothetical protein
VERDKPEQSESVGQTLPQLPWKQKKRDKRLAEERKKERKKEEEEE